MLDSPLFPALPLPPHYDPARAGQVWKVPYQSRAAEARGWAQQHQLAPVANDEFKVCLALVDVQNTFCMPDFELFVGGRSGTGAVDDCRRIAEFIYRNLGRLTHITATLDTHQAMQIFHAIYLVDAHNQHPGPNTLVSAEDVRSGKWKFNPAIATPLGISPEYGQAQLLDYTEQLQGLGKYELTIWPYHAMLGGIGHALASIVEEAVFFHTVARYDQPRFLLKGDSPQTENYSAIRPEVMVGPDGQPIRRVAANQQTDFLHMLETFDAVIIGGEAKSHCVAWTVDDLLADIRQKDPRLAQKVYLLDDCSSPVVVPGVVDYTEQAEAAYQKFAEAGMHRVLSTAPIESWPGFEPIKKDR